MHNFLVQNKDLLEVYLSLVGLVSGVLLGAMAIFVSFAANRIARDQAQLMERQNRLVEAELQPHFRFIYGKKESEIGEYDCLEIFNDGKALSSFEVRQLAFLEVSRWSRTSQETRYIPAYYFLDRFFTGEQTGFLVMMTATISPPNSETAKNISARIAELAEELERRFSERVFLAPRVYIQMHYETLLGEWHNITYEIQPTNNYLGPGFPRRLTKEEASLIFSRFWPAGSLLMTSLTSEGISEGWQDLPKWPRGPSLE